MIPPTFEHEHFKVIMLSLSSRWLFAALSKDQASPAFTSIVSNFADLWRTAGLSWKT